MYNRNSFVVGVATNNFLFLIESYNRPSFSIVIDAEFDTHNLTYIYQRLKERAVSNSNCYMYIYNSVHFSSYQERS